MTPEILNAISLVGLIVSFMCGWMVARMTVKKPKPAPTPPWWYNKCKDYAEDADKITIDLSRHKIYCTFNDN